MRYIVCLSVDCTHDDHISDYKPYTRLLKKTEGDEQFEYNYLGGDWENGHHRKYFGEVGQNTFDKLVDDFELRFETKNTGGILTAIGFLPAISFEANFEEAIISAYVCPLPSTKREKKRYDQSEDGWNKICDFLEEKYR